MTVRKSVRRLLATATAALLVASGVALAPTAATATPGTVADATLSWGVKKSFRDYIGNTVFKGKTSLRGTTVQPQNGGAFSWTGGVGTADSTMAIADVAFGAGNGVHFQSHLMTDTVGAEAYALDLEFTNPRVTVTSATAGVLHLDVVGRTFIDTTTVGGTYELKDVNMATLRLPASSTSGGVRTWSGAEATLTEEGSVAFGSFYEAGEKLDPLTFSLPVTVPTAPVPPKPPVDPNPPVVPKPTKAPFADVKSGDKFFKEITWMYTEGVSTGVKQPNGTRTYEPKNNVSREAMAAFLFRQYNTDKNYRAPAKSYFADLKPGDKFYKEISWMYAQKISTGVKQSNGTRAYQPKAGITREAMAAFMYRLDTQSKPATPRSSPFVDVRPGDKFYKEIAWMSKTGLSTGIKQPSGKRAYAPKSNVTREAMAAFLYRADDR